MSLTSDYQAVLIVSFGGPEGPGDVVPFLENVLRGRNVPRERMLEVAAHYRHFGGVSPINAQNRALIEALGAELARSGLSPPIYWGNRNWAPYLTDAVAQMARDGIRRALAFVTSVFSSYSGCRQYLENISDAQRQAPATPPQIDKLRSFYNHPGFIEAAADRLRDALGRLPTNRRSGALTLFTAHSIPLAMAAGCEYQRQLQESTALIAEAVGIENWRLVYQSRSGPASQPWLEPDIADALHQAANRGTRDVVVAPIGFISDHMEVVYDLDYEARRLAEKLGLNFVRAATVGLHPRFVRMIRELIVERIDPAAPRLYLGTSGPSHDVCPADCCPPGRPGRP